MGFQPAPGRGDLRLVDRPEAHARRGGTPHKVPPRFFRTPDPSTAGEGRTVVDGPGVRPAAGGYRWSLPFDVDAARPASRRATGIRNGEQET